MVDLNKYVNEEVTNKLKKYEDELDSLTESLELKLPSVISLSDCYAFVCEDGSIIRIMDYHDDSILEKYKNFIGFNLEHYSARFLIKNCINIKKILEKFAYDFEATFFEDDSESIINLLERIDDVNNKIKELKPVKED